MSAHKARNVSPICSTSSDPGNENSENKSMNESEGSDTDRLIIDLFCGDHSEVDLSQDKSGDDTWLYDPDMELKLRQKRLNEKLLSMDLLDKTDNERDLSETIRFRSQISISSETSLSSHRRSGQTGTAESEDIMESVIQNTSFSVTSLPGNPSTSSQASTRLHQRERRPVSRTNLVTDDVVDGLQRRRRDSVIKKIHRWMDSSVPCDPGSAVCKSSGQAISRGSEGSHVESVVLDACRSDDQELEWSKVTLQQPSGSQESEEFREPTKLPKLKPNPHTMNVGIKFHKSANDRSFRKTNRSKGSSVCSDPGSLSESSGRASTGESEDSEKESSNISSSDDMEFKRFQVPFQYDSGPQDFKYLQCNDAWAKYHKRAKDINVARTNRSPVEHLGQTSTIDLINSNGKSVMQYVSSDILEIANALLALHQGESPSFSQDVPDAFTSEGPSSSRLHCPGLQEISEQTSTEMPGDSDKKLTSSEVYKTDQKFSNSIDTLKMEDSLSRSRDLSQPSCSGNTAELHVLDSATECIHISLLKHDLWRKLNEYNHEMLISVFGSMMVPSIHVKVWGLHMDKCYTVYLEFHPVDFFLWNYKEGKWTSTGIVEHIDVVRVEHPDSPNHGRFWAASEGEIEFKNVKFTNNSFVGKHTKLVFLSASNSYQARVNVVEVNDSGETNKGSLVMFSCPDMVFIAVTSYKCQKVKAFKRSLQSKAKASELRLLQNQDS